MSGFVAYPSPLNNHLLALVDRSEYERILPELVPVALSLGEVLYEAGGRSEYVFFPTGAVISLLYTMEDGSTAEVGLTGNDGIVGVALFLGGDTTPNRAVA